ncbi:hypothetical protein [Acinetobacter guillouiae]|uniref:hypothetical protein n=1 Tax=Acinetobacter guillouiae TaxID=106649 RepID=UPI0026E16F9D|nr:hypothetical protein [Acinetobacter guillouiae]MDO6644554.1 hypothetical protein [Acinetobacter guillouiae]
MEIQNLRLQLLQLSGGQVEHAQAMEKYVLEGTSLNQQMGEAVKTAEVGEDPVDEKCGCFICLINQFQKAF